MSDNLETLLANAESAAAQVSTALPVASSGATGVATTGGYMAPQTASMESFLSQGMTPDKWLQFTSAGTIQIGKEGNYAELLVGIDTEELQWLFATSFGDPIQYFISYDRQMSTTGLPWNQVIAEGHKISRMLNKKYQGDCQTCKLYMHLLRKAEDALKKVATIDAGTTLGYQPTATGKVCLQTLGRASQSANAKLLKFKVTCDPKKNTSGNWGIPKFEFLGVWDGKLEG